MNQVNVKIKSNNHHDSLIDVPKKDILDFIVSKIKTFQEIIKKTILAVQKYKTMDILGTNEINACINSLECLFAQLTEM